MWCCEISYRSPPTAMRPQIMVDRRDVQVSEWSWKHGIQGQEADGDGVHSSHDGEDDSLGWSGSKGVVARPAIFVDRKSTFEILLVHDPELKMMTYTQNRTKFSNISDFIPIPGV